MASRRCSCGRWVSTRAMYCSCGRSVAPCVPTYRTPYGSSVQRHGPHIQNVYPPGSHVQNVYGQGSHVQNVYQEDTYIQDAYVPSGYVTSRYTGYNNNEGCSPGCVILLVIAIIIAISGGISAGHSSTFGSASASNSITNSSQDASASDMARSTIQHYYDAINSKDYHTAYDLWQDNATGNGQSYDQFVAGYNNTVHDDITIDNITVQDENTANVDVTITATEQNGTETFHASYVIGKVSDTWRILSGHAEKTG